MVTLILVSICISNCWLAVAASTRRLAALAGRFESTAKGLPNRWGYLLPISTQHPGWSVVSASNLGKQGMEMEEGRTCPGQTVSNGTLDG